MKNNQKIYLMRHGLDDESFVGGWSKGFLIDEGIKEVKAASQFLKGCNIKKIYHSNLNRTIQTANIVNNELKLKLRALNELRELNKGNLNGMSVDLAKINYPEFFPHPKLDEAYPEGESLKDLYLRIKDFLKNIDTYDNSLLITHRGVINMIYILLNNEELHYNKTNYDVSHASVHHLNKQKIKRIY